MKKIMILLTLSLFTLTVFTQNTEHTTGKVTYIDIVKMEVKIEGDASQFSHLLPNEMKSLKELIFTKEASLYQKAEVEVKIKEVTQSEEQPIKIMMEEPLNIVFTDLVNKSVVEQKEFMTRTFLIEGEVSEHVWKMSGNQKMIHDYPCQEAVLENEDKNIKVWFTPAIPVSAGPESYNGLPGLILEVNIDDGEHIITAKNIELDAIPENLLSKPTKGKKVSKDEFDKIVAERIEEMGGEPGEGKVMMIKIQN